MDRSAPATPRQLWALYCATKQDYRNKGLTMGEAHDLLEKLNEGRQKPIGKKDAKKIMEKAIEAGHRAMAECVPTPMVVGEHENPLNDNSPLKRAWFVSGGVCGFAWVKIPYNTPENRRFINQIKKTEYFGDRRGGISKAYEGGFQYWVSEGGQSMEKKEAFARGFAKVLAENGIKCYVGSRMD